MGVVGTALIGSTMQSCAGMIYVTPKIESDKLIILKSSFIIEGNKKDKKRKFVMVDRGEGRFPICVYRIEDEKYASSLMECTHQGCELNVGGGIYSCPCHGSEFSIKGEVLQGPAEINLKTYKTETINENIIIHLEA